MTSTFADPVVAANKPTAWAGVIHALAAPFPESLVRQGRPRSDSFAPRYIDGVSMQRRLDEVLDGRWNFLVLREMILPPANPTQVVVVGRLTLEFAGQRYTRDGHGSAFVRRTGGQNDGLIEDLGNDLKAAATDAMKVAAAKFGVARYLYDDPPAAESPQAAPNWAVGRPVSPGQPMGAEPLQIQQIREMLTRLGTTEQHLLSCLMIPALEGYLTAADAASLLAGQHAFVQQYAVAGTPAGGLTASQA
jgi:hypothetical protein